jgi:hypothetical protein
MPTPGLSFSPTSESPFDQKGQGATNPVQQAIQLLSYRLPQVVGAGAIAPRELLSGGGGQGSALGSQVGSAVAEQWLRKLFMGSGDLSGPDSQVPTWAPGPQAPSQSGAPDAPNPLFDWLRHERGLQRLAPVEAPSAAPPAEPPSRSLTPVIGYEEGRSQMPWESGTPQFDPNANQDPFQNIMQRPSRPGGSQRIVWGT